MLLLFSEIAVSPLPSACVSFHRSSLPMEEESDVIKVYDPLTSTDSNFRKFCETK